MISFPLFLIDQGTSKIEPGVTPRANMTLAFYTWSEFEKNCGYSRLYGGVNFPDSVANIKQMAIQMGRRAIDFIRYHVNLRPSTKGSVSYKAPGGKQNIGGGYTMYSREKYPTTATRRNLVEAEDNEIYDTDYKYFLINK